MGWGNALILRESHFRFCERICNYREPELCFQKLTLNSEAYRKNKTDMNTSKLAFSAIKQHVASDQKSESFVFLSPI